MVKVERMIEDFQSLQEDSNLRPPLLVCLIGPNFQSLQEDSNPRGPGRRLMFERHFQSLQEDSNLKK